MRVMQLFAAVKISVMLIQDLCVTLDPNRSAVSQQEVSPSYFRSDYCCSTGSGSIPSFPIDLSSTHLQ
jgi:hypothetical protein